MILFQCFIYLFVYLDVTPLAKIPTHATDGELCVCEIDIKDISSKITYWKNAVIFYGLGDHLPFTVLNGFIPRLWAKHGINKVSMLNNKILLLRTEREIGKNEVLQKCIYYFDNKSFIVKAWSPKIEFTREELYTVSI